MVSKIYRKLGLIPVSGGTPGMPESRLTVTKPLENKEAIYFTEFGACPSHISVEKVLELHPELKECYPNYEFKLISARRLGLRRFHGSIDTTDQNFFKNRILVAFPKALKH